MTDDEEVHACLGLVRMVQRGIQNQGIHPSHEVSLEVDRLSALAYTLPEDWAQASHHHASFLNKVQPILTLLHPVTVAMQYKEYGHTLLCLGSENHVSTMKQFRTAREYLQTALGENHPLVSITEHSQLTSLGATEDGDMKRETCDRVRKDLSSEKDKQKPSDVSRIVPRKRQRPTSCLLCLFALVGIAATEAGGVPSVLLVCRGRSSNSTVNPYFDVDPEPRVRESTSNGVWQLQKQSSDCLRWSQRITQQLFPSFRHHIDILLHNGTLQVANSVCALGVVSAAQSLRTMISSPQGLLRKTITASVRHHSPTKVAWQEITQLVDTLQSEPSLQAWRQYSPHVVWQSLRAIRRLQQALPKDRFDLESAAIESEPAYLHELTQQFAYYSVYATLVYGWPMALARLVQGNSRGRYGRGRLQNTMQQLGLNESNILHAEWQSETHRPAYLLVKDPRKNAIVLTVRGTWSACDILTDLCCTTALLPVAEADHNTFTKLRHWLQPSRAIRTEAHSGMVQAAVALKSALEGKISSALQQNPGYRLVLVGHSMGGGAAALLGFLWQTAFDKPYVYVYGPPCVASFDSPLTNHECIHSVVMPGDPFCTLSLGHVTEMADMVDYFARHHALRRRVCRRPVSSQYASEIWELLEENIWTQRYGRDTEYQNSAASSGNIGTKLVPPGKVWYLVPSKRKRRPKRWRIERASTRKFLHLMVHPLFLDLTQHVPTLYEQCLLRAFEGD